MRLTEKSKELHRNNVREINKTFLELLAAQDGEEIER